MASYHSLDDLDALVVASSAVQCCYKYPFVARQTYVVDVPYLPSSCCLRCARSEPPDCVPYASMTIICYSTYSVEHMIQGYQTLPGW